MSVFFAVKHAMIVTEYMENGALDKYLKVCLPQFTTCLRQKYYEG